MKHLLIINQDNTVLKYQESKFDREIGDVLQIDGVKWKVCNLFEKKSYCLYYMRTFGKKHLWNFHSFEKPTICPKNMTPQEWHEKCRHTIYK
jgi:hypothetical protein